MREVINKDVDKWVHPWNMTNEEFKDLHVKDERFFSILIKGCLGYLNSHILMYNEPIKHFIFNTGSSYLYVEANGYDFSWTETTGEDYMYMKTPRCVVNITNFTIPQEELTNPFIRGNYERRSEDGQIKGYNAEMRRLPIEVEMTLQYVLSNFNEQIILIQELFDSLVFQKYFNITYLGQIIPCSIEFPNSQGLNLQQPDLASADNVHKTIEVSIKLNSLYPIINEDTEIPTDHVIAGFATSLNIQQNKVTTDKEKYTTE